MVNVLKSKLLNQLSIIRFSYPTDEWKLKFDMRSGYVQDDKGRWFEVQGYNGEYVYLMIRSEI